MQAEPPESDPPKRKRRWFQFSLRTLLIGVTLFCMVVGGYVGSQAKIVKERKTMLAYILNSTDTQRGVWSAPRPLEEGYEIPWIRDLLGDQAVSAFALPVSADKEHTYQIHALFPEALIMFVSWENGSPRFAGVLDESHR
jgi:hypothetical protein